MKVKKATPVERLKLNRETLRDLMSLRQVAGGISRPAASCYPVVCFPQTVASGCC